MWGLGPGGSAPLCSLESSNRAVAGGLSALEHQVCPGELSKAVSVAESSFQLLVRGRVEFCSAQDLCSQQGQSGWNQPIPSAVLS